MKKLLSMMLLFTAMCLTFSACSKDDDEKFDYPMETLYGNWKGTGIYINGSWIDVTSWLYYEYAFSIKFNSDGTYSGKGYFGNGSGTYKAVGNMIYTYVDGEEYAVYKVKSLTGNKAELSMGITGSDEWLDIKAEKE